MIVYGQNGKGKGKLGSSVYSINHGVQIKREYNGTVNNPNSAAQVNQRSRFKLASQVSAALAPIIVIPRRGIQSPRNLFVKKNFDYFYATPTGAQVTYENLQVTPGSAPCPRIVVSVFNDNQIEIALSESVVKYLDHVCYNVFSLTSDGQMVLADSVVVDVTEENDTAGTELPKPSEDFVVYAYGMRMNTARARGKWGNYKITTGEDIAALVASRKIEISDVTFSMTRGTTVFNGEQGTPDVPVGSVMVYVDTIGDGSVAATGLSNGRIVAQRGSNVVLTATPGDGESFLGWKNNGEQNYFSYDNPLTIVASGMRDIIAEFTDRIHGLE